MRPQLQAVSDGAELEETMSATASCETQASRSDSPFRIAVARAGSWARLLLAVGVKLWVAHRDERILMQAPPHQLRDIGIERADIRWTVRSGRMRPR